MFYICLPKQNKNPTSHDHSTPAIRMQLFATRIFAGMPVMKPTNLGWFEITKTSKSLGGMSSPKKINPSAQGVGLGYNFFRTSKSCNNKNGSPTNMWEDGNVWEDGNIHCWTSTTHLRCFVQILLAHMKYEMLPPCFQPWRYQALVPCRVAKVVRTIPKAEPTSFMLSQQKHHRSLKWDDQRSTFSPFPSGNFTSVASQPRITVKNTMRC